MSERTERIMQDTARLVDIPSQSGHETKIVAHIGRSLQEMGHTGIQLFGELGQASSIGVFIPGRNPNVLFVANGHLDTVSSEDDPLIPPEQSGDWLYGHGAGDMKAGIALMLDLAREYSKRKPPCDIFLSFVDKEETTSEGSRAQAQWIHDNLGSNYPEGMMGGVILEPTYSERAGTVEGFVGFGHRGGAILTVTAEGEGGHSGQDYSKKTTAIGTLVHFLGALPTIQKTWEEPFKDRYGKPTINATVLLAGERTNVVPSLARAKVNVRSTELFSSEWPWIRADLQKQFGVAIEPPDVDLSVSSCNPASRIYQTVEAVMPGMFDVFPFATDQPEFTRNGIPMVIYGPGDVEKLHGPKDRVHRAAIEESRKNIREMIEAYAFNRGI